MKLKYTVWIAFVLVACSDDSAKQGGNELIYPREKTGISCSIHEIAVYKVPASAAIHCYTWDPQHGLSVESIRQRFPYAIWDANLYRIDESVGASMPRYNLICDRCVANWKAYVSANPLPKEKRFVISVNADQEILINDSPFTVEQIPVIAKLVSNHRLSHRVNIKAHRSTPTELIRSIVKACEREGLTDVIFGSYVDEYER